MDFARLAGSPFRTASRPRCHLDQAEGSLKGQAPEGLPIKDEIPAPKRECPAAKCALAIIVGNLSDPVVDGPSFEVHDPIAVSTLHGRGATCAGVSRRYAFNPAKNAAGSTSFPRLQGGGACSGRCVSSHHSIWRTPVQPSDHSNDPLVTCAAG